MERHLSRSYSEARTTKQRTRNTTWKVKRIATFEIIRCRITKKKAKIMDLKKKVDNMAMRIALLSNELTKNVVLHVPETKEESEITKKAEQVKDTFNSPLEAVAANLAKIQSNDEKGGQVSMRKVKEALRNIGEYVEANFIHTRSACCAMRPIFTNLPLRRS